LILRRPNQVGSKSGSSQLRPNSIEGRAVEAIIGLILGMLLGIIGRELWPRWRELLITALLLLIWTPIVWFMLALFLRMPQG
jgi:galactitol-specific phosphotransferase system IIC component